jgi:hypothetical protein
LRVNHQPDKTTVHRPTASASAIQNRTNLKQQLTTQLQIRKDLAVLSNRKSRPHDVLSCKSHLAQ